MAMDGNTLFTIITPSTGNRPRALQKAVQSVESAVRHARLSPREMELLIGFGGFRFTPPESTLPMRSINFPPDNRRGNSIRNMLVRIAKGRKLIFLDDDNILKPNALRLYLKHFETELVIGRIDTQLISEEPCIPLFDEKSIIHPENIDPLCVCVNRELVADRCSGWNYQEKHDSAFLNLRDWHRRAKSIAVIDAMVGVYDYGRSMDHAALSQRQQIMLDNLCAARRTMDKSAESARPAFNF